LFGGSSVPALSVDVVDDRADERPVSRVARIELHGDLDPGNSAGCERDAMDRIGMRHRSDERYLIHHLGQSRQPLADVQAGDARGNATELDADLKWGFWLRVKGLELARRAVHEQEDARLRAAESGRPRHWEIRG